MLGRPLVLVVALGLAGCPPAPSQDYSCVVSSGPVALDSLVVGAPSLYGSPSDPWLLFADGDPVCVQRGRQGLRMIQVRLGMRGAQVPGCVDLAVEAHDATRSFSTRNTTVQTVLQPDGAHTTGNIFLPGDYPPAGASVTVDARVGSRAAHVVLKIADLCPYLFLPDMADGLDMSATPDSAPVEGGATD